MSDRKLVLSVLFKGADGLSGMMRGIMGVSGGAQEKLHRLSQAAREQKSELKALRDQIGSLGVPTQKMIDDEKRLAAALDVTTRKYDQQKTMMARQSRWDARGQQARDKGMGNVATGIGISAGLFGAGKAASDFQDGMTDIRQKANLTADETARLEANILRAADAAKQLPEPMRAGVDTLAGFGLSPQQAAQMMSPIGRAATAYRAEIADLSAASFAVTDNLKVPIGDTARALDIMAAAGKSGAFELKDMAIYFPALTAAAQGLKQTGPEAVADLSAALQIARKGAGDAASAATNVQNLLAKINSTDVEKNFAKFGVNLPKALKKAYADGKTPLEAIADLVNQTTKGDLSQIGKLFGDMQAQQALRPLIQNMGEYRRIREEALKAKGTVDADFAIRSQNAAANARQLMGNLMNLAMVAGNHLLPAMVEVSGKISGVAEQFAGWAKAHPGQIDLLMKFIIGLAGLNLGLGAARIAFGTTIGPLIQLWNGFQLLRGMPIIAGLFSGGLAGMGTAISGFGAAMGAAGAFLMANPIVLVIAAIVAALAFAVPWIIKNWDALKAGFGAFFGYLAEAFKPAIDGFMGFVNFMGGIVTAISGPLKAMFDNALKLFLNFTPLGWLLKSVMPMIDWLKSFDWSGLGKMMIQGMIDGIFNMFGPLGQVFKKAAEKGIDAFKAKAAIHSPSRVFKGFGVNIAEGLGLGIRKGLPEPMRQAALMATAVAGAAGAAGGLTSPDAAMGAMTPPAAMRPASGGAARPSSSPPQILISKIEIQIIAAPGQNETDIASAVQAALRREIEQAQARARSAYHDDED